MNVIKLVQAEYASPIVFTPEKDRSLRFCVDNPTLEAVTINDAYQILQLDKCIESLRETQIFLTLVANSGY